MTISIVKRAVGKQTYIVLKQECTNYNWMGGIASVEDEMVLSQAERFARELLATIAEVRKAENAARMYQGSRFYP